MQFICLFITNKPFGFSVSVTLQQCWSEVDLSIIDRISTILRPETLCQTQLTVDHTLVMTVLC